MEIPKELGISAKEPYISAKVPYIFKTFQFPAIYVYSPQKSPTPPLWSCTVLIARKLWGRALYLCKRVSFSHNRALYLCCKIEPYISMVGK